MEKLRLLSKRGAGFVVLHSGIPVLLVGFALFHSLASNLTPGKAVWRNPKDRMEFVWIPPGRFTASIAAASVGSDTTPQVVEFRQGFWMGRTEVTVRQFRRFVQQTSYVTDAENGTSPFNWKEPGFKQGDDHPVVYISYGDATSYARWAGVELPTQSEWLYACRAGSTTRFYWGDEVDDRFVWHRENAVDGTRAVGRKRPNLWGLYDMVGNAWEYCRVCDNSSTFLGGSWTRCHRYLTRQGSVAEPLAWTVEPVLEKCESNNLGYPWDDDRGFRCVKHEH